jgi:hypothetical protein
VVEALLSLSSLSLVSCIMLCWCSTLRALRGLKPVVDRGHPCASVRRTVVMHCIAQLYGEVIKGTEACIAREAVTVSRTQ